MGRPSADDLFDPLRMDATLRQIGIGHPDVVLELERLRITVRDVNALAERSAIEQSHAVTLAWLRRLTHELARLEACWRDSMPQHLPTPRRRRDELDPGPAPRPED